MKHKAIANTVKIPLSTIPDEEVRDKIQLAFTAVQAHKEDAVEAYRKATRAKILASMKREEAELQLLDLLAEAGEHIPEIKREPIWFVYMKNGELVFENPFNERDMRNYMRLERAERSRRIDDISDNGNDDLYESGNSEE